MENFNARMVLQPGASIKPKFSKENVPALVKKFYGLETKLVKELNGYNDKNFHIKISKTENPYIPSLSENGYVLKILNSKDSEFSDIIEVENHLMQHLNQSQIGVSVQRPLKNLDGNYISIEIVQESENLFMGSENKDINTTERKKHIIRLLEYIPGKIMKEVQYTQELIYEVGKLSGRFYHELKNFDSKVLMKRKIIWQLESLPLLHHFLFAVTEERRRNLVKEVLSTWESHVIPILPSLEKSVIHGDINEHNVIVAPSNRDSFRNITGLIDFGDSSFSPTIFELAISIAYVILEVNNMDPNEAAGFVIAGFSSEKEITENEWIVLRECVAARSAQSLILGAYTYSQDPGNEYLLCTAKIGWERLRQFWETSKDELIAKWKSMTSVRLT